MKAATHPVLGTMKPDPIGDALGTGFMRFASPSGIKGLAKLRDGNRLDLLAVVATNQGTGQFRLFLTQCQSAFATICVWHVDNQQLHQYLFARGFREYEEREIGDLLQGVRWDR